MRQSLPSLKTPSHFSLAYDVWVPEAISGGLEERDKEVKRNQWLKGLEGVRVDPDYDIAYERWEQCLVTLSATQAEVTSVSRLLIGHGNPSGSDVGLTVQHTWGVPMIPASSLKGLLQHHLVAKYGPDPDNWTNHPLDPNHPEPDRASFQPVYWRDQSIKHSPGDAIRILFGAPTADSDNEPEWRSSDQIGAARGALQFLDAWWKPGTNRQPFVADILNVHQRKYYGQDGKQSWPNDYDAPNPVQFITVKPTETFLLAICGDESLAKWAMKELVEALTTRGIGGKTSAGYGMLELKRGKIHRKIEVESSPVLETLNKCLDTETLPPDWETKENQRQILEYIKNQLMTGLNELNALQRKGAADSIMKKFGGHKKLKDEARKIADQLSDTD